LTLPFPEPTMQPESSDGFASVGTILPEGRAALLPGGSFRFCGLIWAGQGLRLVPQDRATDRSSGRHRPRRASCWKGRHSPRTGSSALHLGRLAERTPERIAHVINDLSGIGRPAMACAASSWSAATRIFGPLSPTRDLHDCRPSFRYRPDRAPREAGGPPSNHPLHRGLSSM
jgi:hypothetical protein